MPKLIMQPWIERDSWSGSERSTPSLHLSIADRDAFVKKEYGDRSGPAPECYFSAEEHPQEIEADHMLYNKVKKAHDAGKLGIYLMVSNVKPYWSEVHLPGKRPRGLKKK